MDVYLFRACSHEQGDRCVLFRGYSYDQDDECVLIELGLIPGDWLEHGLFMGCCRARSVRAWGSVGNQGLHS